MCRIVYWKLKFQIISWVVRWESTFAKWWRSGIKFVLLWVRSGGPAGSHEEEGCGRPAREQLESPGAKPEPPAGEGRHCDSRRRRDRLVHRLLAEAEGDGARGGESYCGGEGPNGEVIENSCIIHVYSFNRLIYAHIIFAEYKPNISAYAFYEEPNINNVLKPTLYIYSNIIQSILWSRLFYASRHRIVVKSKQIKLSKRTCSQTNSSIISN